MREIKFRAKTVTTDSWVYGHYAFVDGFHVIYEGTSNPVIIKLNTLGEYTGLKDKNGQGCCEIYEGDILGFCDFDSLRTGGNTSDKMHTAVVKFSEGSWVVEDGGYCDYLYQVIANDSELEIIGNIYENPELLVVDSNV